MMRLHFEDSDGDAEVTITSDPKHSGITLVVDDPFDYESPPVSVPIDRLEFIRFLKRALKKLETHT